VIEEVISEIKKMNPSLIEMVKPNQSEQHLTKYFQPKYISYEVYNIVHGSYERLFDFGQSFVVKPENNRWQLTSSYLLAESDNEKDIQEIKQLIMTLINDALKSEDFKVLKKHYADIKLKHDLFISEVNEIIKDVENGIILKGRCGICQRF
jgi:hypothetical protein